MNTLPVGTLLRERYFIKNVLGSGVTGTTYLVKDQQARDLKYQLFALAEICGLSQQIRYQFTFNGTTLRQLDHPALPRIYHVFNDDKRACVYVLMDYVEGTNLQVLCSQHPAQRLSWPELYTFCEPLVAALIYLHHQEIPIFHGDIKPTNIMQNVAGKILFLNLGYGQTATLDAMQWYSPTPDSYRAPEQFTGNLNERSDVYGLAAMLYRLLIGQPPPDALTRLERGKKKTTSPSLIALKAAPDVPRSLIMVLEKALALDPTARFQSIREFWQALVALAPIDKDATPVANKQSTTRTLSAGSARQSRSSSLLLPVVAIFCILLLLVASAGVWVWASAHPRATTANQTGALATHTSPISGGSSFTPNYGAYTALPGTYKGKFTLPNELFIFTLLITNQRDQGQFSGRFISSQQNGTVNGTIDLANDVQWTVIDASGNASLIFFGGLNGVGQSKNASMGGYLFKCTPNQGTVCIQQSGPNNGGNWTLSYTSSSLTAFRAPQSDGW